MKEKAKYLDKMLLAGQVVEFYCGDDAIRRGLSERYGEFFGEMADATFSVYINVLSKEECNDNPDVEIKLIEDGMQFITGGAEGIFNKNNMQLEIAVNDGDTERAVGAIENILRATYQYVMISKGSGFTIHAGSAVINDRAVLYPGWSGSGKSTLSRLLHNSGLKILSDDLSVLLQEGDRFYLCGSPFFGSAAEIPRVTVKATLSGIYFISQNPVSKIIPMEATEAIPHLITHIPYVSLMGEEVINQLFEMVNEISKAVSVWRFPFAPDTSAVKMLMENINELKEIN